MEFLKAMDIENKLLLPLIDTAYIQKLLTLFLKPTLVKIQVSELTGFHSKEGRTTLGWVLQEQIWKDWLLSLPFWEMFTNHSFILIA